MVNLPTPSQTVLWLGLRDWVSRHCPRVLRWCTIPYTAVVRLRRTGYHRGWFSRHRLPKPVISVGNLTVGGTGKTPFVMWLAAHLHARGKRVAILTRGYGRQGPATNRLVSNGRLLTADWRSVGDEAFLMAQKCPWAVVAVGPDRFHLGSWVLNQVACDCFLLDDGYQHLSLHRDLDVLLFDATDADGLTDVLPAGRLREPLSAAQWATALIFTRAEHAAIEFLQSRIESEVGRPIAPVRMDIQPGRWIHIPTGEIRDVEAFRGKSLLLISGVGNPASFRSSVLACGLEVKEEIRYPDHFCYSIADVEACRGKLKQGRIECVMTTEKDAVRLKEFLVPDDQFWALEVQVTFPQGEAVVTGLLQDIWT